MKEKSYRQYRIRLFPKSKLYFTLNIFPNHDEMIKEYRIRNNDPDNDFGAAWVWNLPCKNKLGELFMESTYMDDMVIEHELIHVIFTYLRHKDNTKLMSKSNPLEEELAYIFPYIKQQINCCRGASRSLIKRLGQFYQRGKDDYRWHQWDARKKKYIA
jgi:chloramphenicol O-acetyltransferase